MRMKVMARDPARCGWIKGDMARVMALAQIKSKRRFVTHLRKKCPQDDSVVYAFVNHCDTIPMNKAT